MSKISLLRNVDSADEEIFHQEIRIKLLLQTMIFPSPSDTSKKLVLSKIRVSISAKKDKVGQMTMTQAGRARLFITLRVSVIFKSKFFFVVVAEIAR